MSYPLNTGVIRVAVVAFIFTALGLTHLILRERTFEEYQKSPLEHSLHHNSRNLSVAIIGNSWVNDGPDVYAHHMLLIARNPP